MIDGSGDDFLPLRVMTMEADDERSYDRVGRRRLIEGCIETGVSIAGMVIPGQVDTNQP
ncbi:hypothetical protein [Burkholderia stabilis]